MFKDFSAKFGEQSVEASNIEELSRVLPGFVQACLDPRISPEVAEQYKHLLMCANEAWKQRFGWSDAQQASRGLHVYLYQAEMESEEVRYFAGFRSGVDLVLMDEDGNEFLPIVQSWERDCGTRNRYCTSDAWGEAKVIKVRAIARLGR